MPGMGYAYSRGWRGFTVAVIRPLSYALLRRDWRGGSNIPATGGLIVAANHISEIDPLPIAHYLYENGRYPVFLAKSTLFEKRFIARIMRETGQIRVDRGGPRAALSLEAAHIALADGQCVVIYPEGTCTRDPDLWPMAGRTGVARLALATGVPVIPLASWGAHELLPYPKNERWAGSEGAKPGMHLLPRRNIQIAAGSPVELADYGSQLPTEETLRAATFRIMRAITDLLEQLRDQQAPKRES
jgi:1-acyl-sn-glycerol-3-phosphate acyltransferase